MLGNIDAASHHPRPCVDLSCEIKARREITREDHGTPESRRGGGQFSSFREVRRKREGDWFRVEQRIAESKAELTFSMALLMLIVICDSRNGFQAS
jgi:hypothetical protein